MLIQDGLDFRDVVAGINNNRVLGVLVAKDRAVALQHANGKNLMDHAYTRIMDPTLTAVLSILMRWIHIISVITLLGAIFYSRAVMIPALGLLDGATRSEVERRVRAQFRPIAYLTLVGIVGSGLYNYLTKPQMPAMYHMLFGMKFLLVMHIVAVTVLYSVRAADEAKQKRWLAGMAISGLVIVAL